MIVPTKRVSDLKVGDALTPQTKSFSAIELVMYAGATWDWHRLHYDQGFAQDMNLPAPIIDGQIYGALFAKQAIHWLGPKAFVKRLNFRMRAMAFAGDTLSTEGEVEDLQNGSSPFCVVLAQRLTRGGELIAEARTEVVLPD